MERCGNKTIFLSFFRMCISSGASSKHKLCKKINVSHKRTQETLTLKFGRLEAENLPDKSLHVVCQILEHNWPPCSWKDVEAQLRTLVEKSGPF